MKGKTIGEQIRRERKRQGLTMEQLGERMGISGSLVGRYERDEENPKIETIKRFADALDIPISELYPEFENVHRKEPAMHDLNELLGCLGSLNGPWRNDSCLGYASLAMEQVGLDSRTICRVLDAMVENFDFVSIEEAAHRIHHGNGVAS